MSELHPSLQQPKLDIVYRRWASRTQPPIEKIKLEVPGWAGEPGKDEAQPWVCKPFVDGNTMGFSLPWALDHIVNVECPDGETAIYSKTPSIYDDRLSPELINQFAPGHYGIQTNYSIRMPPGWGMMILPTPEWFMTQPHTTVPAILPGILEFDWFPTFFFVVSRLPEKGQRHVYYPGDPICQLLPVPLRQETTIREADREEYDEMRRQQAVHKNRYHDSATHSWETESGHSFSNIYKVLAKEFAERGEIDWTAHEKGLVLR